MALSQEGVARAPRHLDAVQAAALPARRSPPGTRWSPRARSRPGDVVLVQGTGGVSLFALLFAKMHGARVLATSSSDEKLERVRAMGADHVVNYKTNPDWHKVAREITSGTGVDLVVEVAGTLDTSIRAVRASGTVALIGVLAGATAQLNLGPGGHAEHPPPGRDGGKPRGIRGDGPRHGIPPDGAARRRAALRLR